MSSPDQRAKVGAATCAVCRPGAGADSRIPLTPMAICYDLRTPHGRMMIGYVDYVKD